MPKYNRILLTGVHGQLGHALKPALEQLGTVIGLERGKLDLTSPEAIRDTVRLIKPDLIINPAAYTAVDQAESEPDIAHAVNGIAPSVFAEEAARINALLVHYSTGYVFDGRKQHAYSETDPAAPINAYGAGKLAGEQAIRRIAAPHLILRTNWVYSSYGKNFMLKILELAQSRAELRIINDQIGNPTSTNTIVDATLAALGNWEPQHSGTYHLVDRGETSWHAFACSIIQEYEQLAQQRNWPALRATAERVMSIPTSDYPTPAQRPLQSSLDTEKLRHTFKLELPNWQEDLRRVMAEMAEMAA
ncbi:dTDP-4-dehydrorhamnose reductase [Methylobacillus flagellatus]|nr:dTDP-4-dehydrorhamnose reductase [Methylobacillus flagellatus]